MAPVDDIIINRQMPQKKKGKGILIIILLLLIILIGLSGFYYWYTNMYETPKMAFFKYISQNNIAEIFDTEIYYNMIEKINSESFESSTTANFTTNIKNNFTENADVSKFELNVDVKSNKEDEKNYAQAKITYLSNDIFDVTFLSDKENMAIGSTEVLDKYLATSKQNLTESIDKTINSDIQLEDENIDKQLDNFINNKINLDEEYKKQKINEYMQIVFDQIPEEAVTLAENSQITINSSVVNSNAYTMELDANVYKNIVTSLTEKLKNDNELLGKIVNNKLETVEENTDTEGTNIVNPINIIQTHGETEEHTTAQIEGESELEIYQEIDDGPLVNSSENEVEIQSSFPDNEYGIEEEFEENAEGNILGDIALALVLNQKLNMTPAKLKSEIVKFTKDINFSEGIKATVYVKNVENEPKETLKIVAKLPNTIDVDIEYPEKNKIKVTSLQDVKKTEGDEEVTKNEGISFEIKRMNSDMQTKFDIIANKIEEKKVVTKIQIDLTTQGTKTSKNYTNEAIIKYNDNETNYKINIKNKIDLKKITFDQAITDENAIFIDQLSEEEANQVYLEVFMKLMSLYVDKVQNMSFLNVNANDDKEENNTPYEIPNVQKSSEETAGITKIEARDLLIAKIEAMMAEAEENEEEFTILNLQLLPDNLQGNTLTAEVTEEKATIKIAEYTFYIDKDFMLTEE